MPSKGTRKTHCIRGHERIPENLFKDGVHCKLCDKLRDRSGEKDRERAKEWVKQDKLKNPEKYKEKSARDNARISVKNAKIKWEEENPDYIKEYYIKNKEKIKLDTRKRSLLNLGWTLELYDSVLKEQNGVCAICKEACPSGRNLAADHEHTVPPKPRGLLCVICNLMIGYAKDNPSILRLAADYIEKYQTQNAVQPGENSGDS